MPAGVLCNPQCPDQVLFGELTSNNWHVGVKIFITSLVVCIAVICVIVKLQFDTWLYLLERKLNMYLDSLYNKQESPAHVRPRVSNFVTDVIIIQPKICGSLDTKIYSQIRK